MKLSLLLASALIFLVGALPVQATDVPAFPSCTSPTGSVKVSYDSGVHGIPGDSGEYIGSDTVYTVSDTQLTQCFCAASGAGIQTNWWKVDSLDQSQINELTNDNWVYIPDGSAWGLGPVPYLAQNTAFSCAGGPTATPTPTNTPSGGQPGAGPTPVCDSGKPGTPSLVSFVRNGTTAKLTWTAASQATHYTIAYGTGDFPYGVPNTGNVTSFTIGSLDPGTQYQFKVRAVNNCMPGDWSGVPTGIGGGEVLGLAATGNSTLLYTLLALGGVSLILAFLSRRRNQRA